MLYSAWFKSIDTDVVPVGSGKEVVRCTTVFSESKLVAGVESIGIIDRDYWPQRFLDSLPNSINVSQQHTKAVDPNNWGITPSDLFYEEKEALENALKEGAAEFMRYYPGKVFLNMVSNSLGMGTNSYIKLICSALTSKTEGSLMSLGKKIEKCLKAYLPTRGVDNAV